MKNRKLALGALAVFVSAASATALQAQSVPEIVNEAMDRHDARTANIDNYTIHQKAFNLDMKIRFERQDVDGRSVLMPVSTDASMGQMSLEQAREQTAYTDPWRTMQEWMEGASLEGEDELNGKKVWKIRMNEFPEDAFMIPEGDDAGSFEPKTALMFIDQDEYLLHRLELSGTITADGQEREAEMVTELSDYRGEQGLLHPHSIKVQMTGLMDDEQAAEAREGMAKMQEELAKMDPAQRAMVEGMLKDQMKQFEDMLSDGNLTMEIITTRLEVNTPAG